MSKFWMIRAGIGSKYVQEFGGGPQRICHDPLSTGQATLIRMTRLLEEAFVGLRRRSRGSSCNVLMLRLER